MGLTTTTGCSDDDSPAAQNSITLSINKLEDVGANFFYKNWLIVDGSPVAAGTFLVDSNGVLSETKFLLPAKILDSATEYVLTIEPSPDPTPSKVHVLGGDFVSDNAEVSIDHPKALGTNFSTAAGNYVLATLLMKILQTKTVDYSV